MMEIKNPRLKYIWETATDTSGLKNNREIAQFHYFNPNGLYARKKNNDERIWELIEAGVLTGGYYYTNGGGNHYHTDNVRRLATKRRVNTTALSVALQLLKENTEEQEATITKATA
jgi:hypothetical protein